jgi:hypothetical protein
MKTKDKIKKQELKAVIAMAKIYKHCGYSYSETLGALSKLAFIPPMKK